MKKINFIKSGVTAVAAASLLAGTSAFALTITTSGNASSSVQGGATTTTHANTSAGSNNGNGTSSNSEANANSGLNANINANVNATTLGHTSTTSGNMSDNADITFPVNVSSDAQLQTYTQNIMSADANIANINASEANQIIVQYKHPGKFLGIFPVHVTSQTTVSTNSDNTVNVKVKLPWWSMFVTGVEKSRANIETALQSSASLKSSLNAQAGIQGRAQAVYNVLAALRANMTSNTNTTTGNNNVNSSTNTNANTDVNGATR
jgi:hypothetical protein